MHPVQRSPRLLSLEKKCIDFVVVIANKVRLYLSQGGSTGWACLAVEDECLVPENVFTEERDLRWVTVLEPLKETEVPKGGPVARKYASLHFARCTAYHQETVPSLELGLSAVPPPSQEQWLQQPFPRYSRCNVYAMTTSLEHLEGAFKSVVQTLQASDTSVHTSVALEQAVEDPCLLNFVQPTNGLNFAFRVASVRYFHSACGCIRAPHTAAWLAKESRSHKERFAVETRLSSLTSLAGWLGATTLPGSTRLLLTLCSRHGILRVCPEDTHLSDYLDVIVDLPVISKVHAQEIQSIKPPKHIKPL